MLMCIHNKQHINEVNWDNTFLMECVVNGVLISREIPQDMTLLRFLRDELHLTGTKEGCSEGECGACTVLIDKKAINSCILLAIQVMGKHITTIEGLAADGELDRIQQAFIHRGAIQCGYCSPGMIIAVKALLIENPNPNEDEIKMAISGNICRCTGYKSIVEAVQDLTDIDEADY